MKFLTRFFPSVFALPQPIVEEVVVEQPVEPVKPSMILAHLIASKILETPMLLKVKERRMPRGSRFDEWDIKFKHDLLDIHVRYVVERDEAQYYMDDAGIYFDGVRHFSDHNDYHRFFNERAIITDALSQSWSFQEGIAANEAQTKAQNDALDAVQKLLKISPEMIPA